MSGCAGSEQGHPTHIVTHAVPPRHQAGTGQHSTHHGRNSDPHATHTTGVAAPGQLPDARNHYGGRDQSWGVGCSAHRIEPTITSHARSSRAMHAAEQFSDQQPSELFDRYLSKLCDDQDATSTLIYRLDLACVA